MERQATELTSSPSQTTEQSEAKRRQPAALHDAEQSRISVTINKRPEEVYRFFRNFGNLPLFMKDISRIDVISEKISHWVVKLSHGPSVEWDAEIIVERPNEMISWKSMEGSEVIQAGSIWFLPAPGDRGTIVRLSLNYTVPGGKIIEFITKLMGEDPNTLLMTNLKRLKAYMETGEIPTTEGQPSGRDEDAHPVLTH